MQSNAAIAVLVVIMAVAAILGFVFWKSIYRVILARKIEKLLEGRAGAESSEASSSS